MQIPAVFRSSKAGNEFPSLSFREIKVSAVDGRRAFGIGGDQKTIRVACFPWVDQMTVSAGAFVSKVRGFHADSLGHELHPVLSRDLTPIGWLFTAVPDGKNYAPFRRTVHLDSKISAGKSAGFVVRPNRVGLDCHLVVEPDHLRTVGSRIGQVDGWCS